MPQAITVQIAISIAEQLAAASFSKTIEVVRTYVPTIERDRLRGVKVLIFPGSHDEAPFTRCDLAKTVPINVAVFAPLDTCSVEDGDALMYLIEEIKDSLATKRQAGAIWQKTEEMRDENQMPYILAEAKRSTTLASAFRLTYHAEREIDD